MTASEREIICAIPGSLVTSVRVSRDSHHARVRVWLDHACAGELVCDVDQADRLVRLLFGGVPPPPLPSKPPPAARPESMPTDLVDVSGLDRAELLAALHNATCVAEHLTEVELGRDLTAREALTLLDARRHEQRPLRRHGMSAAVDYVFGRPIKCDLDADLIDFHSYDAAAGPGAGAAVVAKLRGEKPR